MKFTYAVGQPLAGREYLIHGTLAAGPFQRNGNGRARALEKEIGIGEGLISLANVTTLAADVVVEEQVIGTLDDTWPVAPTNNGIARHFRYLMAAWREHDLQTAVLFTVLMVTRFVRYQWPGLTKAQWNGLVGACWDASSNANVDGE